MIEIFGPSEIAKKKILFSHEHPVIAHIWHSLADWCPVTLTPDSFPPPPEQSWCQYEPFFFLSLF